MVRKTIFIFSMAIWLCTSSDWCGNEFGNFDMQVEKGGIHRHRSLDLTPWTFKK